MVGVGVGAISSFFFLSLLHFTVSLSFLFPTGLDGRDSV